MLTISLAGFGKMANDWFGGVLTSSRAVDKQSSSTQAACIASKPEQSVSFSTAEWIKNDEWWIFLLCCALAFVGAAGSPELTFELWNFWTG